MPICGSARVTELCSEGLLRLQIEHIRASRELHFTKASQRLVSSKRLIDIKLLWAEE